MTVSGFVNAARFFFWLMSSLFIVAATSDHLVPAGDASARPSTGLSG
jgi:hypothetical protein